MISFHYAFLVFYIPFQVDTWIIQQTMIERFRWSLWCKMFLNFRVAQATFYEVRERRKKRTMNIEYL